MPRLQYPGARVLAVPGADFGTRIYQPGAVAAAGWWDPDGSIGCCVGAYQAKGAASYATSLVNLANPGVNDLTEGNGAVPWAAGTGWSFVVAAAQYLITGLTPPNGTWSALVQYANSPAAAGLAFLFGCNSGVQARFSINNNRAADVRYSNGQSVNVAPNLNAGNLGISGAQGYRNGIADGGAIGAWIGLGIHDIYIGCRNNLGVAGSFRTADIHAIPIYNCTLTAPQMALVAAAMAAL